MHPSIHSGRHSQLCGPQAEQLRKHSSKRLAVHPDAHTHRRTRMRMCRLRLTHRRMRASARARARQYARARAARRLLNRRPADGPLRHRGGQVAGVRAA
eukprot:4559133-Pleurochrysis_carterae.AAC.3